ncbi:MAG: IMP dehydrogenase [Sphaerochaetaceae bacterium]|nr:IMP dehydrogenase [Sphaerochaetaceae bacterium]
MAKIYEEVSRTFNEYLLIPRLTKKEHFPDEVSLKTPITRFRKGERPDIELNIPFTSAIMQAVSDDRLAIALALQGGLSFIYSSQSIKDQAAMIRKVKQFKLGFVESRYNLTKEATLSDVVRIKEKTDHSTITITSDGSPHGMLEGIITSRDWRVPQMDLSTPVVDFMTPFDNLICGEDGITLDEAYDKLWDHKLSVLPIIHGRTLSALVFRKDYDSDEQNPSALMDEKKSYMVGAGVNTHDYRKRIPILVESGADVLCIDSSDGYSEYQKDVIDFVRDSYGDRVKIGAGNVVDGYAFRYLADAGADFIKIGVGGGSICITREQKGIGRGQATAILEVAKARDAYYEQTGIYIPIASDGGIVQDYHVTLALAMGADFVMLGRYFARFEEAPGRRYRVNGNFVKEYWGEGSNRARNWARYDKQDSRQMTFEEGVDSYVPYAGPLKDNLTITLAKIKSTMVNSGCMSIKEFRKEATLTVVSQMSLNEGSAHDVILKEQSF